MRTKADARRSLAAAALNQSAAATILTNAAFVMHARIAVLQALNRNDGAELMSPSADPRLIAGVFRA